MVWVDEMERNGILFESLLACYDQMGCLLVLVLGPGLAGMGIVSYHHIVNLSSLSPRALSTTTTTTTHGHPS